MIKRSVIIKGFSLFGLNKKPQDLRAAFKRLGRVKFLIAVAFVYNIATPMSMESNGLDIVLPLSEISGIRYSFYALALGSGLLLTYLNNNMLAPRGTGDQMLQRARVSGFVVLMISGSSVLLGQIIFFLTETMIDLYVLAAYALILFVVFFPRYGTWQEHEQRESQSSLPATQEATE